MTLQQRCSLESRVATEQPQKPASVVAIGFELQFGVKLNRLYLNGFSHKFTRSAPAHDKF